MEFKKSNQGFTVLHLIILIAVIAILTAIFYPTFIRSNKALNGSYILSDLRNIENAEMKYYIKYGATPDSYTPSLDDEAVTENQKKLIELIDGKQWPVPPLGEFIIENTDTHEIFKGKATRHSYYSYTQNDDLYRGNNGLSINNITTLDGKEKDLTFIDLLQ